MSNLWTDDFLPKIMREYETHKDSFLRQPTISKTMHPQIKNLAAWYYTELLNDVNFSKAIEILPQEEVGYPIRFKERDKISHLSLQHLYQMKLMQDEWGGIFVPTYFNTISEIGGGYGNFCRLCHQLGFSGQYEIADFPGINVMQREYLKKHDITPSFVGPLDSFRSLSRKITPPSLLLGTFSISEMPIEDREDLFPVYLSYTHIFLAFTRTFGNIVNYPYFEKLADRMQKLGYAYTMKKDHLRNLWYLTMRKS